MAGAFGYARRKLGARVVDALRDRLRSPIEKSVPEGWLLEVKIDRRDVRARPPAWKEMRAEITEIVRSMVEDGAVAMIADVKLADVQTIRGWQGYWRVTFVVSVGGA